VKITTSAPGKVILFGEHAVVYGEPSLSTAISLRVRNSITILDEDPKIEEISNPYLREITKLYKKRIFTDTSSDIPPSSGLGSSAAYTVSTIAGVEKILNNNWDLKNVAIRSFQIEYNAQGRASPNDTSVATLGGYVMLSRDEREGFLWRVEKNNVYWNINRLSLEPFRIAIIFTRKPSNTAQMVAMVRDRYEKYDEVKNAVREIGNIVLEATDSIREHDLEKIGNLMTKNQYLLRVLGVSNEELEAIIHTLSKYCYGAKLTGAGGGGSVIGIPKEGYDDKIVEVFKGSPYDVYIVNSGAEGVKTEENNI